LPPLRDLTQVKGAPLIGLMQLNVQSDMAAYLLKNKSEAVMPEPMPDDTSTIEPMAAEAAARFTQTNKNALEFVFGAQKMLLQEVVFTSNEILDRTRTETHLLSEFVSKMAGSHSVKDLKTMFEECSQHQIDFLRRDSDRLFKHSERMLETASNLLANRPQP
jgi:hypothetical protein